MEKVHNGQVAPISDLLNERRRAILERAVDAFVEMDPSGLITGWNAQAEVLFGWPRSEALGRKVSQLVVAPGRSKAYDKALEKFFHPETEPVPGCWLETTALHRDGHEFPIELGASVVTQGEACRMAAFVRDMTREKETEKEAEKRHRAIMDQLGEAYTETDLRGNYVYTGKGYYALFNRSEDPAGINYKDLF